MAHPHDLPTPSGSAQAPVVDFTDVVEALVSPVPPEATPPAPPAVHLRAVDPADQDLPAHHDTVVSDAAVHDLVLMEDFAGELRRWLASATR